MAEEDKQTSEEAQNALLTSEESRKNLEARVDCLQARLKMTEELWAKERVDLKKTIEAAEDKFTNTTMYRIWSMNPDLDHSFLEG